MHCVTPPYPPLGKERVATRHVVAITKNRAPEMPMTSGERAGVVSTHRQGQTLQ